MKLKKILFAAMLAGVLAVPAPLTFAQEAAPAPAPAAAAKQDKPELTAPEEQKSEKKDEESNEAFLKSPMVVKIGHALGMSASGVRSRLARATARLRSELVDA